MRIYLFLASLLFSSQLPAQFESEPNDSKQSANIIVDEIVGNLNNRNDEDWYVFNSNSTGSLILIFSTNSENIREHWSVSVENSIGTILTAGVAGDRLVLSASVESGSTYFIKISRNTRFVNNFENYSISLTLDQNLITEVEANDSEQTANSLVDGIAGNLSSSLDEDWYVYTASVTGASGVNFSVSELISYDYWNVAIFNDEGILLSASDAGQRLELLADSTFGSTYYIRIQKGSTAVTNPSQYTLNLVSISGEFYEVEDNDEQQSANSLIIGISGNLSSLTDQDWFVFNATESGSLNFGFTVEESSKWEFWEISILDSLGNLLTGGSTGRDVQFQVSVTEDQTYYVQVQQGSFLTLNGANYTLNISNVTDIDRETEPNNSQESALRIVEGISGNIYSEVDEDWYSIQMTEPGTIKLVFSTNQIPQAHYWQISIFDSNSNLVGESLAYDGLELNQLLDRGEIYFIRVTKSPLSNLDSSPYTIILEFESRVIDSGTFAELTLARCNPNQRCIDTSLSILEELEASDNGNSGVSELSLFDNNRNAQGATIAAYSGPMLAPHIDSYVYTSGPQQLASTTVALQSYRFEQSGVVLIKAKLTYSQSGAIELIDSDKLGVAAADAWIFRMENNELDLGRCSLISDLNYTADVNSFSLCVRFLGSPTSQGSIVEIDGFLPEHQLRIIGDDPFYFPNVINQSVDVEIAIEGSKGEVIFLLAKAILLSHSGGFAEINDFTFEFGASAFEHIVSPAYSVSTIKDLPGREVLTDVSVSNGMLFLPLIQINDQFYQADFQIVENSNPLQIQFLSAIEIFNTNGLGATLFDGTFLTIPNLLFNEVYYTVVFQLVDGESLIFEMNSFHQN